MTTDYGLLAEFPSADALLAAVAHLQARRYTRIEAYTPYPIEGLPERLGERRSRIPLAMLLGALAGGCGTLALEYYSAVIAFPLNVGGRPDASWPAFIPAALEMTILCAVLAGVLTLLIGCGLPRLHHPLFASTRFETASRSGFFVLIRADDPEYETGRIRRDLHRLDAIHIERIAA